MRIPRQAGSRHRLQLQEMVAMCFFKWGRLDVSLSGPSGRDSEPPDCCGLINGYHTLLVVTGTWILLVFIYWEFYHPNWQSRIFSEGLEPLTSSDSSSRFHGAGIFTYMTGWFCSGRWEVFQHYGAYRYKWLRDLRGWSVYQPLNRNKTWTNPL